MSAIWGGKGQALMPRGEPKPLPVVRPAMGAPGGGAVLEPASSRRRTRTGAAALTAQVEAAAQNRRLKEWQPTSSDISSILASSGSTILRRSRDLVLTNPYAASGKEEFATSMVGGTGVSFSSTLEDEGQRNLVNETWKIFAEECDADEQCDLYGLEEVIAGALFDAGECFVRLRPRLPQDGLHVPLQLQVLEAEMLDFAYTTTAPNGNRIKSGKEFNAIGQCEAFHFFAQHPGDRLSLNAFGGQRVRVPARDVLHIYDVTRPGQLRGMPKLVPAMVRMYLLDMYDDAELDRKKVAALLAGFITTPDNVDDVTPLLGESASTDTETAERGVSNVTLAPGSLTVLNPGEEIAFSQPADVGGNYEAFQYRNILAVCAAMGVPYSRTTGDVFQATYSSLRTEALRFRARIRRLQLKVMVHQLLRGVSWRFFQTAVLAGRLSGDPVTLYRRVLWTLPKWDWVDPLKDRQAEKIAVEMGTKARGDVIIEEGGVPEEVDQRRAQDQERERRLGLKGAGAPPAGATPNPAPVEEEEEKPRPRKTRTEAA